MSPVNWRQSYLFPWFDVQNTVTDTSMILAVNHKATGLHSLKRQEWEEGGRLGVRRGGENVAVFCEVWRRRFWKEKRLHPQPAAHNIMTGRCSRHLSGSPCSIGLFYSLVLWPAAWYQLYAPYHRHHCLDNQGERVVASCVWSLWEQSRLRDNLFHKECSFSNRETLMDPLTSLIVPTPWINQSDPSCGSEVSVIIMRIVFKKEASSSDMMWEWIRWWEDVSHCQGIYGVIQSKICLLLDRTLRRLCGTLLVCLV